MIYLVFTVLLHVGLASILKVGELYQQDRLVVMGFNYLFASLAAAAGWAWLGTGVPGTATLVLGPVGGFFFAMGLFLWMGAIATAGMGLATAAIRLAVLWPTLLSFVVFAERASAYQWGGVVLTFGVLGMLAVHSLRLGRASPGQGAFGWLLATFMINGGVGITQKLFTELAPPQEKLALLTLVFGSAGILSGAVVLWRRRRLRRGDVLRGLAFGCGNLLGGVSLLKGLETVPGVVAFPFVSVCLIAFTAVLGMAVWRERPGRLGVAAVALAGVAIVLMTR